MTLELPHTLGLTKDSFVLILFTMALVKASELEFELPVQTITADGRRWLCWNVDHLTRAPSVQLEQHVGMKMSDASGRRWIVRSVRKVGRAERWHILHLLFFDSPDWRVDYVLEELPPKVPIRRKSDPKSGKLSSDESRTGSGEEAPARSATHASEQMMSMRRADRDTALDAPAYGKAATLVMASTVELSYPLVGFTRSAGALAFGDPQALTTCRTTDIRDDTLIGMELIDSRLRRWIVRSLAPTSPIPMRRWWQWSTPYVTFDLGLDAIAPIDLNELKSRLLKDWELEDPDERSDVRRASSLAAILEAGHHQASGLL